MLNLGEQEQQSPSDAVPSPGSLKRQRRIPHQKFPDIYDLPSHPNDADAENDRDAEDPTPKKQRRTKRRIPSVSSRNAALQDLNGPRQKAQKLLEGRLGETKISVKMSKRKRRVPRGELVTISERLQDSDIEVTGSEFSKVLTENDH